MNALTLTRLAANLLLVCGIAGVLFSIAVGVPIESGYIIGLGAVAILGAVAQFVVSIFRPRAIRPSWDEQTVASHRGSYQFGYWAALIGFWVLFFLSQSRGLEASEALLWIGAVLICAPSVWMAIATFRGRAG
ncbi:hypothetical protein ABLO27_02980 [Roseibium sp. SCPC15]|uniref:hypothetical protein n=1 Tax=Roseibium sp. SCP15 TaxID=3141376 RepID=UPI00333C1A0C